MKWSMKQTTAPSSQPVTLAEAKAHLRVDIADDDTLITNLIKAATIYAESVTRRQFIDASFTLYLPEFPGVIEVPRPPIDSVTTLKYYNSAGTLTTLTAVTDYVVDTTGIIATVRPAYSKDWPATRDVWDAVQLIFKAGYGAATTDVPEPIRQAILLMVGHWYAHREPVVVGTTAGEVPLAVGALLSPYRVWFQDPEGEE